MPAPDAIASLQKQFPGKVGQVKEFRDEYTVEVDREIIRGAAIFLKGLGYNYLVDISSVDHFGDEPRYESSTNSARSAGRTTSRTCA